jgi:subtilisin family serine protease
VTRGSPDILIAVIDTGVSSHPDLAPALWQNDDPPGNGSPADDATDQDGSGAVEDWEREDDDDNGYVDDAHGYDFVDAPRIGGPGDAVERDSDPADDSGHGTAVAGVVGAAAENGIGIAGLAPDCRLMIVRAGFNPGLGLFSGVLEEDDAAAAIVYAAENGRG